MISRDISKRRENSLASTMTVPKSRITLATGTESKPSTRTPPAFRRAFGPRTFSLNVCRIFWESAITWEERRLAPIRNKSFKGAPGSTFSKILTHSQEHGPCTDRERWERSRGTICWRMKDSMPGTLFSWWAKILLALRRAMAMKYRCLTMNRMMFGSTPRCNAAEW